MPCLWMYRKAHPSSAIQNRTASSVKLFLEMWNRKSPPFIKSTTRYLQQPCERDTPCEGSVGTHMYSISWKLYRRLQIKGWFRCSSIRRSRIIFRTLSDRMTIAMGGQHTHEALRGKDQPSSLRIYFRAKVRPVSFLSTMRTFPNAPLPTTRRRRK